MVRPSDGPRSDSFFLMAGVFGLSHEFTERDRALRIEISHAYTEGDSQLPEGVTVPFMEMEDLSY